MSDNVLLFRRKPTDPRITQMKALRKITEWSGDMLKAGHMPQDVQIAFATFFGKDEPTSAPPPPSA